MPHPANHPGETYQGEIYCVDCSATHEVQAMVQTNGKGQHFAEGTCPRRGTPIRKLLTAAMKPVVDKPVIAA